MVANRDYFTDAVKRHGFEGKGPGGNVDHLMADYKKQTAGLDQELAFKALEGGRQFGDNALVKSRDDANAKREADERAKREADERAKREAAAKAKEKAQAHQTADSE